MGTTGDLEITAGTCFAGGCVLDDAEDALGISSHGLTGAKKPFGGFFFGGIPRPLSKGGDTNRYVTDLDP